jgi:hypothetical protein
VVLSQSQRGIYVKKLNPAVTRPAVSGHRPSELAALKRILRSPSPSRRNNEDLKKPTSTSQVPLETTLAL